MVWPRGRQSTAATLLLSLVGLAAAQGLELPGSLDPAVCAQAFGASANITAIFTANPGGSNPGPSNPSSIGESYYLEAALNNAASVQVPGCFNVTTGTLAGAPTLLITTGEGPIAAAVCATAILRCSASISSMLFFGTAGFSPRVGGVLDPPNSCEPPASTGELVRVGDLCITYSAVNWDCQGGAWTNTSSAYPDVCNLPGAADQPLSGLQSNPYDAKIDWQGQACALGTSFSSPAPPGSAELAAGLLGAAALLRVGQQLPADAAEWMTWYWGNMSQGMGFDFHVDPTQPPAAFGPDRCAEVDSVWWWSGLPWEAQARGMVAGAVGNNATSSGVVAASAMEGVGWLAAVAAAANRTGRGIPYAILRSASNYVHQPVRRDSAGLWVTSEPVALPPGVAARGAPASPYAIATGSATVMAMLQARCESVAGVGAEACKVDYSSLANWSG